MIDRPVRSPAPRSTRRLAFELVRRYAMAAGLGAAMASLPACGGSAPEAPPGLSPPGGRPLDFGYPNVDGSGVLASTALRGRPAVIIFVTTYDLASQAEARFLSSVVRRHDRPFGAAAIVLEAPEDRPLVLAFRDTLGLRYPVALGDRALIAGDGPFGAVTVPTTIVLDRDGRIAWRQAGLSKDADIEQALRQVEQR